MPVEAPMYVWPVQGELERWHNTEKLSYDVTMRDWRTHEGIDIMAPLGATVSASHSGVVESIVQDYFYGTVVTVDHGDGSSTVYANLAELPAVNVGDWVEPGDVIGAVGTGTGSSGCVPRNRRRRRHGPVRERPGNTPALCRIQRRRVH